MANQPLVTEDELPLYGLSEGFLEQFDKDVVTANIQAISDECVGRMSPRIRAPLLMWGNDVRAAAARIIVYELKSIAGMAPTQAAVGDENIFLRAEAARKWFSDIGQGIGVLQDYEDSSVSPTSNLHIAPATDDPRGW